MTWCVSTDPLYLILITCCLSSADIPYEAKSVNVLQSDRSKTSTPYDIKRNSITNDDAPAEISHVKSYQLESHKTLSSDISAIANGENSKNAYKSLDLYYNQSFTSPDEVIGDLSTTTTNGKRKRKKRCKCLKRYLTEVTNLIDERIIELENRYRMKLNADKTLNLAMQNEVSSSVSRLQEMDRLLLRLTNDLELTKNRLIDVDVRLNYVTREVNYTRGDVSSMGLSFKQLGTVVDELRLFVSRMKRTLPTGMKGALTLDYEDDRQIAYPRSKCKHLRLCVCFYIQCSYVQIGETV